MILWIAIGVVSLIVATMLAALMFWQPLFHDRVWYHDRPWCPLRPIMDGNGSYGFVDHRCNLCVLVMTGDPETFDWWPSASPFSATLLVGSPYETTVHAQRDALIVVHGEDRAMFTIDAGTAKAWYQELAGYDSQGRGDVPAEILRRYRGPESARLKQFIEAARDHKR